MAGPGVAASPPVTNTCAFIVDHHAAFLYSTYARLRSTGASCSLLHQSQGGMSRTTLTLEHGPHSSSRAGPPVPPRHPPQPLFPHPHPQHPHHTTRRHRGPATRARDQARRSAWLAARQAQAPHPPTSVSPPQSPPPPPAATAASAHPAPPSQSPPPADTF